jgi:hypothetical protein
MKDINMNNFSTFDILAVSVIGLIAIIFLIRTFIKMRKNKSVTMCNGCSGNSCSTKTFVTQVKQSNTGSHIIHRL